MKKNENWLLSKPYVFNVLYFSLLGWVCYSIYKDIKGEEIDIFGFDLSPWVADTHWLVGLLGIPLYFLFAYLKNCLAIKRLEMESSNRIDYFKDKQEKQKELIEKSK